MAVSAEPEEFLARRVEDVRLSVIFVSPTGGRHRGVKCDLADAAAGEVEPAGEKGEIELRGARNSVGIAVPRSLSRLGLGTGEFDAEAQAPGESGVEISGWVVVRIARPSNCSIRCSR